MIKNRNKVNNAKTIKHINVKAIKPTVPKMMTVREVAKTGILSEYALRQMLKQNKLPAIYSGSKALINYDLLCNMLNNLHTIQRGA